MFGPMVLMGLGGGLAFSPLNIIIMSTVPAEEAGAAGGVLQTLQQVGGTLGLAILVTVFGTSVRNAGAASPENVMVGGMTAAFVASTIIATLTFVVALTFRKVRASDPR
jgi:MFS family permease